MYIKLSNYYLMTSVGTHNSSYFMIINLMLQDVISVILLISVITIFHITDLFILHS